jgi:hypothetical protein
MEEIIDIIRRDRNTSELIKIKKNVNSMKIKWNIKKKIYWIA